MKETSITYARIVLILLAINMAFTGYAVYRLSETQQAQIDSVNGIGTPTRQQHSRVNAPPVTVRDTSSEVDSNSTDTPATSTVVPSDE
jgi:hypothetical protein|tara:strand:+ start:83 stop:346 length:264 start_codon:yes stop_codon:yes gene_type:complete